ncbi:Thymidylate kinase [Taenia crassiceps]|uniref:dTMP kinase n=1 Tax=Taenia crassiceps TaxID=6207 RepID=A0ABR4QTA3_9CEST
MKTTPISSSPMLDCPKSEYKTQGQPSAPFSRHYQGTDIKGSNSSGRISDDVSTCSDGSDLSTKEKAVATRLNNIIQEMETRLYASGEDEDLYTRNPVLANKQNVRKDLSQPTQIKITETIAIDGLTKLPPVIFLMKSKKGLFVVLEGLDRVGKSTQARMLAEALSGIYGAETYLLGFPDRSTPIGRWLSDYLSGKVDINPHAVHLLFTANRWERASDIQTALEEGRCVVLDRYSYSGIVYTASKAHSDPPTWEWCLRSEEDLPQPDLVVCLVPSSVDDLADRGAYGKERFENAQFQTRVLANYHRLAKDFEEKSRRGEVAPLWRWIDVENWDVHEVHKLVLEVVLKYTEQVVT